MKVIFLFEDWNEGMPFLITLAVIFAVMILVGSLRKDKEGKKYIDWEEHNHEWGCFGLILFAAFIGVWLEVCS